MMQAGFAMLCAGSVRAKNVKNIMLKVRTAVMNNDSQAFSVLSLSQLTHSLTFSTHPTLRTSWTLAVERLAFTQSGMDLRTVATKRSVARLLETATLVSASSIRGLHSSSNLRSQRPPLRLLLEPWQKGVKCRRICATLSF